MDLFLRTLIRAAYWARHPPSKRFVIAVGVAVLFSLAIVGIEHVFGWPEFLKAERIPRPFVR